MWDIGYISFFLSFMSKGMFSVVNAACYIALVLLVIRNATDRPLTTRGVLSATCLVLFFCDIQYDPPYQIGYIWMAVLVLAFIHLFFNIAKNARLSVPVYVGLFFFSLIAGNAQEAINIGVGGALILFILMNFRKLTVARWCMTVGFVIGELFLCLSPAAMGHTEEMIVSPIYSILNFFLSLRATYIFLAVLIYKLCRRQITLESFCRDNAFFINAIIVLIIFNFSIGIEANYQLFGIELFTSILLLKLLHNQSFSKPVLYVFAFALVGIYILKYIEIRKADDSYKVLSEKISENPTGPIFVDFPAFNPYIHPTPIFMYGVSLDHTLTSIAREMTGSDDTEPIPCYPTEAEKLFAGPVINGSYQYLPGEFMLMQSKKNPKRFTLHRSIHIFGIRIPLPPYAVEFDAESHLNTDNYNILFLPSILPVIENESVTID